MNNLCIHFSCISFCTIILLVLGFLVFLSFIGLGVYYLIRKKWLPASSSIVFAFGYIIYYIGFYEKGTSDSFAIVLRPFMSSMEMFVAHSDLLEVCPDCKNNPIFMTFFAFFHFFAIVISLSVVLNWIYYIFFQSFKLKKRMKHSANDLYIFFDTNDSAWTLAESIERHYVEDEGKKTKSKEDKNKKCENRNNQFQIIFIDEPNEIEDKKEKKSFVDLLGIKAFREKTQERIKSKEIKNAFFVRSDKNISSHFSEVDKGLLWGKLGLDNILSIIKKGNNIRIFLFSDDTEDNLRAVQNIINWKDSAKWDDSTNINIEIYCKARHNEKNSIYEESSYLKSNSKVPIHVYIVDDSSLAVLTLKKNKDSHPIRYVTNNKTSALVNSSFDALILGFGQTGRDAFRFLYEYATFPCKISNKNNDERSPIKLHVFDRNMDTLKGGFLTKCPALLEEKNQGRYDFQTLDVKQMEFWEELKFLIQTIKYVVIALGDDDTNISVAVDLYKFALRYRTDLSKKFDIYVRLYTLEKEKEFKEISNFFNNNSLVADKDNKGYINNQTLIPFGAKNDIYSYETIIKENAIKKAQIFAYIYNGAFLNDNDIDINIDIDKDVYNYQEAQKSWNDELDNHTVLTDIWNRIRQNEQDISNSWHIQTKIQMMRNAELLKSEKDYLSFKWPENIVLFNNKDLKKNIDSLKREEEIGIVKLNFNYEKALEKRIDTLSRLISLVDLKSSNADYTKEKITIEQIKELENIAKCEHLRWNALSELQGYTTMNITSNTKNEKDFIEKKMSCLCPWETLKLYKVQDATRVYDYNIVLGSLLLHLLEKEEKEKNDDKNVNN